jgi:hypothetical protein
MNPASERNRQLDRSRNGISVTPVAARAVNADGSAVLVEY